MSMCVPSSASSLMAAVEGPGPGVGELRSSCPLTMRACSVAARPSTGANSALGVASRVCSFRCGACGKNHESGLDRGIFGGHHWRASASAAQPPAADVRCTHLGGSRRLGRLRVREVGLVVRLDVGAGQLHGRIGSVAGWRALATVSLVGLRLARRLARRRRGLAGARVGIVDGIPVEGHVGERRKAVVQVGWRLRPMLWVRKALQGRLLRLWRAGRLFRPAGVSPGSCASGSIAVLGQATYSHA